MSEPLTLPGGESKTKMLYREITVSYCICMKASKTNKKIDVVLDKLLNYNKSQNNIIININYCT